MKNIFLSLLFLFSFHLIAQVNYTANDQVKPYTGLFRPGINLGYYPPYSDMDLGNIAAGNKDLGISGIGARATRPGFSDWYTTFFGFDTHVDIFQHYEQLGMKDLTCIVGFPADEHRDTKSYCSDGTRSEMFANLYTPIWDNWANGTPYNDENYLAAYMYKLVTTYKDYVKFWEIWNEPGFDHSGDLGWRPSGSPGNWFDNDPDPCANHTHAPVQHFIRTLRICYDIIKTIDPDAYVALSGVGYESFLDAVLRNTDNPNGGGINPDYPLTGGAYFDVMGFHTYPDIDGSVKKWNPSINDWEYIRNSDAAAQGVVNRKRTYEKRLAKYGYDGVTYPKKEWICTEMNAPRVKFNEASMASDESQVNYIIKAVVNSMKVHLRQIHPYQLADTKKENEARDEFDLLGMYLNMEDTQPYDKLIKTNEGIAYKTTSDFVFGTRFDPVKTTAMMLPSSLDGAAFYDENKKHFKYIIWAKTLADLSEFASGTYSFPNSFGISSLKKYQWNYSEIDSNQEIGSDSITLSGRPIFLEEDSVSLVTSISLSCPANIEVELPNGSDEVGVTWPNISASTTCPDFAINFEQTQGQAPGSFFKEGIHEISYMVSDSCGNEASCSFIVKVIRANTGEITVTCPDDIYLTIPANETKIKANWDSPVATSTCPNSDIQINQIGGFPSGTEFFEGEYTINYEISDACDSKTCSFKIIVEKATNIGEITLECPNDITVNINSSDTSTIVNWEEPSTTSTCSTSNIKIVQTMGLPSGSLFSVGTHLIEYQAMDDCDQKTCSFTIIITKSISGELSIECPNNIEILIPKDDSTAIVSWDEPIVTSSCPSSTINTVQTKGLTSGSLFPVGAHLIEYEFKDDCDQKTCSFWVTVSKSTAIFDVGIAGVTLTPNPATENVLVKFNSAIQKDTRCSIYNVEGQLIYTLEDAIKNGVNQFSINIENFEKGVYFLSIKNTQMQGVFRFVKM